MNEFEAAAFYGVSRTHEVEQGEFVFENFESTYPHEEIFELDVPF